MEQKINIAEILKDCPKGMELDCILFNNPVKYNDIDIDDAYPIKILTENDECFYFTKEGYLYNVLNSKCLIFPKGKTTWEGFVPPCEFKTGDVLFVDCSDSDDEDKSYQYIFILNDPEFYGKWHSYCHLDGVGCFCSEETYLTDDEYHPRFATEEEKTKLFDAIKANGYKWNEETKTLEKLVNPRFKIGNRIKYKINQYEYTIIDITKDNYIVRYKTDKFDYHVPFWDEDNYDLVPDKFDVINFEPFMKVLVRSDNSDVWECDFFSSYNPKCSNRFHCIGAWYNICIPYIGNEHLRGTTNDCDEYFKNWE